MKRGCLTLGNKRGDMVFPPVIFIILNIIVFSAMFMFVSKVSTGAIVYEQAYAKQIALILDQAKSEMQIRLDFSEGFKVAEENEWNGKLVDIKEDRVVVKLGNKGGYSMRYFSDYNITAYLDKDNKIVILNIKDKPVQDDAEVDFSDDISIGQLRAAVLYARDNIVEKKQCLCYDKCGEYANLINTYSEKKGINPLLVLSMIIQESDCIQNIGESSAGCVGLMQVCSWQVCEDDLSLTSTNWEQELGDVDKYSNNIQCGIKILGEYQDKFTDAKLSLAAYNWGETRTRQRCLYQNKDTFETCKSEMPSETVTYVEEVSDRYALLLKESEGKYVASIQ